MKTNIDRVYSWIHYGKEQVFNVYYKSGLIRHYYVHKNIPVCVSDFIKKSYVYFVAHDIKMYKLTHD